MPRIRHEVNISLQLFDLFTLLQCLRENISLLFTKLRKNRNDTESKVKLQSMLSILEQILNSGHCQRLYKKDWNLYELKNPSVEQLITVIEALLAHDDLTDKVIKLPPEVRRFCDKFLKEAEDHYS